MSTTHFSTVALWSEQFGTQWKWAWNTQKNSRQSNPSEQSGPTDRRPTLGEYISSAMIHLLRLWGGALRQTVDLVVWLISRFERNEPLNVSGAFSKEGSFRRLISAPVWSARRPHTDTERTWHASDGIGSGVCFGFSHYKGLMPIKLGISISTSVNKSVSNKHSWEFRDKSYSTLQFPVAAAFCVKHPNKGTSTGRQRRFSDTADMTVIPTALLVASRLNMQQPETIVLIIAMTSQQSGSRAALPLIQTFVFRTFVLLFFFVTIPCVESGQGRLGPTAQKNKSGYGKKKNK